MRVLIGLDEPRAGRHRPLPDGGAVEWTHVGSAHEVLAELRDIRFDAVVLGDRILGVGREDARGVLSDIRCRSQGATLLVYGDETLEPASYSGLVDGVLPATASAAVQLQILHWAVNGARVRTARDDGADHNRELEQSEARFRDVIERNADAIVVVDRTGTIRFANRAAALLFRRRRDELTGTPFGHPVVAGETTELDLWRGGDPRVVEMRVVESEWEGEEARIATLRDITERRESEASARALFEEQTARAAAEVAARRFRLLAEASKLLASSLDHRDTFASLARMCVDSLADWVVIYVSDDQGVPQRLEAAHRDRARNGALRRLLRERIDPRGNHPVLRVLQTHEPVFVPNVDDAALAELTQDDTHRELLRQLGVKSLMLVPLIARDRCLGAIAFVAGDEAKAFDESDLAQVQDLALRAALAVDSSRLYREAQDANRAKSDLLAVISHDLRTPLNAIMGFAELLEMGIPDELTPASLERVDRIRASARHLLYLIDELLSFARLDAGHESVEPQEVDARIVAKDVAAVVEPLALKKNLSFHVDIDDTPALLRTDPDKLRQVLLNLASNALKYTEHGSVRLGVHGPADGAIILRVTDTGVGIAQDHLPHIFEPFWQVHATRGTPDGGTGLGLSVVERLVRLLGGTVSVESRSGDGSTFAVTLPQDRPASSSDAEVEDDCSPDQAVAGIR